MPLLDGLSEQMSNPLYDALCESAVDDELDFEFALESVSDKSLDLSADDVKAILDDKNPDNMFVDDDETFGEDHLPAEIKEDVDNTANESMNVGILAAFEASVSDRPDKDYEDTNVGEDVDPTAAEGSEDPEKFDAAKEVEKLDLDFKDSDKDVMNETKMEDSISIDALLDELDI